MLHVDREDEVDDCVKVRLRFKLSRLSFYSCSFQQLFLYIEGLKWEARKPMFTACLTLVYRPDSPV